MATVRYSLVMTELKKSLKRQNTSYAELARQLDVPESTLKKWFNAKDGYLNSIDMICEAMGLSIFGVIRNAEEQNVQTFTFSDTQQKYFLKEKQSFAIYWLLVYERMTTSDVMKKLGIDKNVLNKTLLRLDKIGLVQLGADDNLRIPKMRPIRWKFEGEFMTELLREWATPNSEDKL
jgi:transcriptional regulator with XRE-family HTH domain